LRKIIGGPQQTQPKQQTPGPSQPVESKPTGSQPAEGNTANELASNGSANHTGTPAKPSNSVEQTSEQISLNSANNSTPPEQSATSNAPQSATDNNARALAEKTDLNQAAVEVPKTDRLPFLFAIIALLITAGALIRTWTRRKTA